LLTRLPVAGPHVSDERLYTEFLALWLMLKSTIEHGHHVRVCGYRVDSIHARRSKKPSCTSGKAFEDVGHDRQRRIIGHNGSEDLIT
jgi:hypothetical protein